MLEDLAFLHGLRENDVELQVIGGDETAGRIDFHDFGFLGRFQLGNVMFFHDCCGRIQSCRQERFRIETRDVALARQQRKRRLEPQLFALYGVTPEYRRLRIAGKMQRQHL